MSDIPFRIARLDHIVLRVTDIDRALAFYRDGLGCSLERVLEDLGLYQLRAGDSLIDLVPTDGDLGRKGGAPPGAEGRNVDHLCLRVDPFDAEAICAHLRRHGVQADPNAVSERYGADGYGPSLYIKDPDGNVVELKGPPVRKA